MDLASLDSVVSIRMGTEAYCEMPRSVLVSVSPSIFGMFWSVRTSCTLLDFAFASPSCPSAASITE